jgi:uncharacterized membrane protein YheB (UPF0754 family)
MKKQRLARAVKFEEDMQIKSETISSKIISEVRQTLRTKLSDFTQHTTHQIITEATFVLLENNHSWLKEKSLEEITEQVLDFLKPTIIKAIKDTTKELLLKYKI